MEKIKAILWDMGGVILRTADRLPREKLGKKYGLTCEELDKLVFDSESARRATLGLISDKEHWDYIRIKLGLSSSEIEEFRSLFWSGDRVDVSLLKYVHQLAGEYEIGLISNAWPGTRESLMQRFPGILKAFSPSIFSNEVGLEKPDPRIYYHVLTILGLRGPEVIFIDDFMDNVVSATRLGMKAILFVNPRQIMFELDAVLSGQ